jgi:hypothetical protein
MVCDLDPLSQSPRVIKFKSISRKFEGSEIYAVPTRVFVEEEDERMVKQRLKRLVLGIEKNVKPS